MISILISVPLLLSTTRKRSEIGVGSVNRIIVHRAESKVTVPWTIWMSAKPCIIHDLVVLYVLHNS